MQLYPSPLIIVLVCNNHFCPMLAALLKSIEANQDGKDPISVYIVDDGITRRNRLKISKTIVATNIELIWIPLTEAIPDNIQLPADSSTFPKNIYVRFYIPYFLPSHATRAIYLDTDTLVLKNLKELWNINLIGMPLGAVTDLSETVSSDWGGIPNYEMLGIPPESKYFNSGVLLIDVEKWRACQVPEKLVACIHENLQYATYPDQYGLNVFFANQWLELDPSWNCYSQRDDPSPHIIHFTRMKPIYRSYRFNASYAQLFFRYLNLTPYRGFKSYSTLYRTFIKSSELIKKGQWKQLFQVLGKK